MPDDHRQERLQKVLAHAGIGSRRQCEEYIAQGRVAVDGQVVTEMGLKVSPEQEISFDGQPVRAERKVYFLVNKPGKYVCTRAEQDTGRRVIDLLRDITQHVQCVGRLDAESEGLVIVTNDGELTNLLTHPRHKVPKTYRVRVDGRLSAEELDTLRKGVFLAEGKARAAKVVVLYASNRETILEIELRQGLNRQIRRMLAKIDHKVRDLRRVAVAGLSDPKLKPGEFRRLTRTEVAMLYRSAAESPAGRKKATTRR